jgi:hypothetical protein
MVIPRENRNDTGGNRESYKHSRGTGCKVSNVLDK